jgi:L,D-peptidoglycan transpeptidase YkuD (ErfK/YbiS/YcfS/YnhG family)
MYRRDRLNLHTNNTIKLRDTWSDDPLDPNYNKLSNPETKFSYEKLWRPDPIYDLIGITDYNWPKPEPGLGSAIFLHAWRKPRHPTEGCIAFSMNDLKLVFRLLENTSKIIIKS